MEKNLTPKVKTNQEIEAAVREYFSRFPYKKIGYYPASQKAVLSFDYPDAIDREDFLAQAEEFFRNTEWTAEYSSSMNFSAANLLICALLGNADLKISYFAEKKTFILKAPETIPAANKQEAARKFRETTGWRLQYAGEPAGDMSGNCASDGNIASGGSPAFFVNSASAGSPASSVNPASGGNYGSAGSTSLTGLNQKQKGLIGLSGLMAYPEGAILSPLEQNMALYCAEQTFSNIPDRIYKKSIKTDSQGKYLELSFITPEIGLRHQGLLQDLADQIQWRVKLSDSVNQNELFKQMHILCAKHGLALKQNPSYLPAQRTVQVKLVSQVPEDVCEQLKKDFLAVSGLTCLVV